MSAVDDPGVGEGSLKQDLEQYGDAYERRLDEAAERIQALEAENTMLRKQIEVGEGVAELLLEQLDKLKPKKVEGADYVYSCGCYWFCGNLVACPKHAPKKETKK